MATSKDNKIITMAEAAHRILLASGKKMHYREIMELALKGNMVSTAGKTPEQSLRSLMSTEAKKRGNESRFRPKGNGFYELTTYGKKTDPAQAATRSKRKSPQPGPHKRKKS
jgi:hypothetical protein